MRAEAENLFKLRTDCYLTGWEKKEKKWTKRTCKCDGKQMVNMRHFLSCGSWNKERTIIAKQNGLAGEKELRELIEEMKKGEQLMDHGRLRKQAKELRKIGRGIKELTETSHIGKEEEREEMSKRSRE